MIFYLIKVPAHIVMVYFNLIFAHLHHNHELKGSDTNPTDFSGWIKIVIKFGLWAPV